MKIKITETLTREVEIELPSYKKSNCHFWKIYSEEKAICVTNLEGYYEIGEQTIQVALKSGDEESNEEEFNEAFERIFNKLKNLKDGSNS
jgi:uncharacterized protein YpbB